jgi:hypothetical protein
MKLLERAAIWITGLIICAAFSGVALLFGLAQIYPYRPRTPLAWLLFVLGVPLAWITTAAFGALLDREPMGRWVDRWTAANGFSWVRVLYLSFRTLFVMALLLLAIWVSVSYLPTLRNLVARNFGPDV